MAQEIGLQTKDTADEDVSGELAERDIPKERRDRNTRIRLRKQTHLATMIMKRSGSDR